MMKVEDFKRAEKNVNNEMGNLYVKYKGKIVSIVKKTENLLIDEGIAFNSCFVIQVNKKGNFYIFKNKNTSFLPIKPGGNINKKELLEFIIKCKKDNYLIVGEENIL